MFIGPVFTREWSISARRPRMYVGRATYPAALGVLAATAWLVVTGTQWVEQVGDFARFGAVVFHLLAFVQLVLVLFFSGVLAAGAAAQEKERRTLDLLLLTRMTNSELVLGRLLASLWQVFVMVAAGLPIFMLVALFGGVSFGQIARVFAVTVVGALVCGSLGSTLALWREKTFQALSLTILLPIVWLAGCELIGGGWLPAGSLGGMAPAVATALSPWRALHEAAQPALSEAGSSPWAASGGAFLIVGAVMAVLLNGIAIARVRVWNPSHEREPAAEVDRETGPEAPGPATAPDHPSVGRLAPRTAAAPRRVWNNPVLWREVRTWAYGRKTLLIRVVYVLLFAAVVVLQSSLLGGANLPTAARATAAAGLFLLSLILLNAQAVTSMTSERELKSLDLLLVSDLSPKEVVFGKLGGAFYNAKEMVVLPLALCALVAAEGRLNLETAFYLAGGLLALSVFVAVLGLHAGMIYDNTRHAVAASLGTVFFLLVGVAVCMRMMVALSGSFQAQFQPFVAFMIGGGIGLYLALGARNPSAAIAAASALCPFATFYAMTSYLMGHYLSATLVVVGAYGFATAAMLVPAIHEFDVSTGRATIEEA